MRKSKFKKLTNSQMNQIEGGGWNVWKDTGVSDDCGNSYEQRYNWFGLHGTSDTRLD